MKEKKDKKIIKIDGKEYKIINESLTEILRLPIQIKVCSLLHIGAASSEKKGSVFKVDETPIIPATSFKGALRYQLEQLFIKNFVKKEKNNHLNNLFNILNYKLPDILSKRFNYNKGENPKLEILKPCIPTQNPTKSEQELIGKEYRQYLKLGNSRIVGCKISISNKDISIPKTDTQEIGICPVCYFMGASGIMGFLRINNFFPYPEDRKIETVAYGEKVKIEYVKPGAVFKGYIDIIIHDPVQEVQFGYPRKIGEKTIDKWLKEKDENESEKYKNERIKILLEEILIPAICNIKQLGGYKSRGAGKVNVDIVGNIAN